MRFGTFHFCPERQFDFGNKTEDALAWGPLGLLMPGDKGDGGSGAGISAIGNKIATSGAATNQESSQYGGSFDIGNYLKQLYGAQVGMNPLPPGAVNQEQAYKNQGPLSSSLYNQTLNQAEDPTGGWQSTLQPELQQAQDQINKYYNSRGLLNSGIAIGDMGSAGVDLAIKNAQNEMAYRQQSLQNANALSTNISGLNQQNVQNLSGLYTTQQQAGQNVSNRALQATETGANYQAYPLQAQLGSYYGGVAAQQALPGQLIGAGGQLGAAFMMCWVASEIFGGWYTPKTISARNWVAVKSPKWFRLFYIEHGQSIAFFIRNKPILKAILKPLFELFSKWGRE